MPCRDYGFALYQMCSQNFKFTIGCIALVKMCISLIILSALESIISDFAKINECPWDIR